MADKQLSYDFQNKVRDLSDVFSQMIKSVPLLISLIAVAGLATNTKHEWLEDAVGQLEGALNGAHTNVVTTLTMPSTSGFKAGMVLRFETAAGISVDEQAIVTAVASSTELTVVRGYGGTTPIALTDGCRVIPIARPLGESTDPDPDPGNEPDTEYNYTQIFDRTAKLSKTHIHVKQYGIKSALNYQVDFQMGQLTRDMNNQIIYGRRVERTESSKGSFGGIQQYLEGGVEETTGGNISMDIVNNIFEEIFINGGMSNKYVILAAPNQARRISAFMTAADIPYGTDLGKVGHAVSRLVGDIPAFNGNPYEAYISVDPNLPKDRISVVDLNRLALTPLRSLTDEDATPNGADYVARRLLGEYTMEVKNGQSAHGRALGLNV